MAKVEHAPPHHIVKLKIDPASGALDLTDQISVPGGQEIRIRIDTLHMSSVKLDGVEQKFHAGEAELNLPEERLYTISVVASGQMTGESAQGRTGHQSHFSAEGLYLPGWANWLPLTQHPELTYDLTIETPSAYRSAATGRLEHEELGSDQNVSRFLSEMSLEPPSVFTGPYEVSERIADKTRIRTYFHQPAAPLADEYLSASERYIDLFSKKIGPYPFADFHVISSPLPVGMGFPNLTYVYQRILPMPFMKTRSLAHEVLHNWWGNGVQADVRSGNWSEGLTAYMADHDLAMARDHQAGVEMRLGWLRDFTALPAERDMPVTRFVSKQHDASQAVGYGKVAFIFHMLKADIGEDRFDEALRHFWRQHRFKVAGWRDLRAAFEKVTASDLGWYFDQWITRSGAPSLQLVDAQPSEDGGKHALTISLAQTAPFYRLNVPLHITTEAGTRHFTIPIDGETTAETIELDAKPLSLSVDPDHTLFRRLLPGEAPPILRDILLDDRAGVILLGQDEEWRKTAEALAAAMFGGAPISPLAVGSGTDLPVTPLLVVGETEAVDAFLKTHKLAERPATLSGNGDARAWTASRPNGKAILFVEAEDRAALEAMMRPLPHYRSKSFILFQKGKAVENGVWPATSGPMIRKF